jgi:hypothetical protein
MKSENEKLKMKSGKWKVKSEKNTKYEIRIFLERKVSGQNKQYPKNEK